MDIRRIVKRSYKHIKKRSKPYRDALSLAWDSRIARFRQADVAIFHHYSPPPGGGTHQFVRALRRELGRRGLRVETNTISATTQACLFIAFLFDEKRLRTLARAGCRMVHRVDGPVSLYRGRDDGTDARIQRYNQEFADATIFQSHYSLKKHEEMGFSFTSPHVIMNAADPRIFHSNGRLAFERGRKIRLISSSWSDNPNKGTDVYKWLEDHLDWDRFEYTFVGRTQMPFGRIRMVAPVDSERLADLLRQHDIYLTASRHDPCSNSLIEALSCGLPAVYLNSGGHPEIVGEAGHGFSAREEIPALLDTLVAEYEERQSRITLPALAEVCDRYLQVMGIDVGENGG